MRPDTKRQSGYAARIEPAVYVAIDAVTRLAPLVLGRWANYKRSQLVALAPAIFLTDCAVLYRLRSVGRLYQVRLAFIS